MSTSAERMRRHRQRRAVAARPADELLLPSVDETLTQLGLGDEHAAAMKLAQRYARVIDETADQAYALRWIGPLLAAVLAELGATPAAKAALDKGAKTAPQGPNRLDQLRAARSSSDRGRGRL